MFHGPVTLGKKMLRCLCYYNGDSGDSGGIFACGDDGNAPLHGHDEYSSR